MTSKPEALRNGNRSRSALGGSVSRMKTVGSIGIVEQNDSVEIG